MGATKLSDTISAMKLTADGAMKLLNAAVAKAREMNVPQCISIVDAGGHLLAFFRMDGAFVLSIETSLRKAMTAASYGEPTGNIREGIDLKLAIATEGKRINLPGGLPIMVDGYLMAESVWGPEPENKTAKLLQPLYGFCRTPLSLPDRTPANCSPRNRKPAHSTDRHVTLV
jgi:glc operon protein GlcG